MLFEEVGMTNFVTKFFNRLTSPNSKKNKNEPVGNLKKDKWVSDYFSESDPGKNAVTHGIYSRTRESHFNAKDADIRKINHVGQVTLFLNQAKKDLASDLIDSKYFFYS